MLTRRELATLLAALQFWKDEIVPSGDDSAKPYLRLIGMHDVRPLDAVEIEQFSAKLRAFPIVES